MKKPKIIKLSGVIKTKANFLNDAKINSLIEKELDKTLETDYKNLFIRENILSTNFNIYIYENQLNIRYSVDYAYLEFDLDVKLSKLEKEFVNEQISKYDYKLIKINSPTINTEISYEGVLSKELIFTAKVFKYKKEYEIKYFLTGFNHGK